MIRKEITAYNTDASRIIGKVEKVVFPKSIKEVSEIVRITNLDIIPRGAGTGFEGGVVPNSSLVMDMTKMNKVLSFNPSKRVIVVEAGIILKELNEKLISKGYEFPIDTLNKGISSIGGMISSNASGKRAMKYGSIRDWLDEIEFVNGKGEIIKTSKADLTDACGMEGTTGIITSAKIRVLPKIIRSFSIFQTDKLEDVLDVGRRLKSEKDICSIILISKQVSKMLGFAEKYYLFVEFDSERGKIRGREYEVLLKKIENIYYTLGLNDYYNSEDPKLFFDKIKEFLEILELENTPYFSYLGNGIVHPFFKDSEKEKRRNLLEYIKRTQIKLGKYGFGLRRKDFLDSFESKLIQRVKQRHDPSGKLNKGKLVDFTGYVPRQEIKQEKQEIRIKKPIQDSFKDERLEIKPFIGERLTAKNIDRAFLEEPSGRTGTDKIGAFLEEPSGRTGTDKIGAFLEESSGRTELLKDAEKTPDEKINELIKEVEIEEMKDKRTMEEQTKLSFIEKKEVEDFAKEIPREIIKQTTLPLKPRLIEDYNVIKHRVEDNPEEKLIKKTETSQEERDLINKIMGNRFGNINKEDKKNEHRD